MYIITLYLYYSRIIYVHIFIFGCCNCLLYPTKILEFIEGNFRQPKSKNPQGLQVLQLPVEIHYSREVPSILRKAS